MERLKFLIWGPFALATGSLVAPMALGRRVLDGRAVGQTVSCVAEASPLLPLSYQDHLSNSRGESASGVRFILATLAEEFPRRR